LKELLERYGTLLRGVDEWFRRCLERCPELITCHNGCSACCRGLFDITLLDAYYLKSGFDTLPEQQQKEIARQASRRLECLLQINAAFVEPWLLNAIPEEQWDALMPEEDETPCLLLSESGGCLLYDFRPMTCRLNGIPLIDISGEEYFDEWCTRNFIGEDPRRFRELRFEFEKLFAEELLIFQELIFCLTGSIRNEVDLFIPAALLIDDDKVVEAIASLNTSQR